MKAVVSNAQPSLEQKRIRELAPSRWVSYEDNVVFLGYPGVGKNHLAVSLGVEAIRQGYWTLFLGAPALIGSLTSAHQEDRLDEKLKQLSQYKLLIIDEIGYAPATVWEPISFSSGSHGAMSKGR